MDDRDSNLLDTWHLPTDARERLASLQAWADLLTTLEQGDANVVPIKRKA
ncbi:MAG: hypothetical protein ACREPY_14715 [Rhodanobacteraceae bacterium]